MNWRMIKIFERFYPCSALPWFLRNTLATRLSRERSVRNQCAKFRLSVQINAALFLFPFGSQILLPRVSISQPIAATMRADWYRHSPVVAPAI